MYTFTTLIVGEIVRGGAKAKGNVQTKRSIYIKEKKNIIRARTLQRRDTCKSDKAIR